ncbi:hypothetical protein CSKR_106733 [Clonorchis sinensis]|uniref:Uncharacterized protein n=1 Tax=Clonorchis sinensis TaxID=79923 RepID=A0A3R7GPB1_CLOSI|nr:hypothetical protein CSKR_106733 [Clonorchis sinensis]
MNSANLLTGRSVVRTPPPPLDFPLSRLGQPDSIPALVLPSGCMAVRHRKGVTAERLLLFLFIFSSSVQSTAGRKAKRFVLLVSRNMLLVSMGLRLRLPHSLTSGTGLVCYAASRWVNLSICK